MNALSHIALIGFPVFGFFAFLILPARAAVLILFLTGWLFLPVAGYQISGFPDYDKPAAISLTVLLGVFLFDSARVMNFRPKWFDIPISVFCVWPLASLIANGNSVASGLNWVIVHVCLWGIPYIAGRLYFTSAKEVEELSKAIFLGGLIYAPLCLYEIRMSPQLHSTVYGFFQHSFVQHIRYSGFRPIVFMQHGIMVGTWMAMAALIGIWLWRLKIRPTALGPLTVPVFLTLPLMLITFLLCKTGSAFAEMILGIGVLFAFFHGFARWALFLLLLFPPTYILARGSGLWAGKWLISTVSNFDSERGGSIAARMRQEDYYVSHAMKRPIFGYSNGDFIPKDESGQKILRGNDGFWIITFGMYGIVSLFCSFLSLSLPALLVIMCSYSGNIDSKAFALLVSSSSVVLLFSIDCLFNAMINPIYLVIAGAVSSFSAAIHQSKQGNFTNISIGRPEGPPLFDRLSGRTPA